MVSCLSMFGLGFKEMKNYHDILKLLVFFVISPLRYLGAMIRFLFLHFLIETPSFSKCLVNSQADTVI